ncbi:MULTISPECIES: hypothetical protein [Saccharothrix]|uniref:Peptidase inhibitor I9 n=1 Tax=Saccharothrix longispora TaxID=33920 RepID=A0ABU1Q0L8_9PSEU|nr:MULTISPECIES: hypothetical protein [Saccharothrix]MDR6596442.1 hypothetical protein [Saccharothrix longispora]MDU0290233.1 hypothetical protein [Saccharothrix longispora]
MRRALAVAGLGLVLAGCGAHPVEQGTTLPLTSSAGAAAPALSPNGEDSVAEAKRDGVPTVTLTIAAEQGRTEEVVASLQRLGAVVEASDAAIGYVRAAVPVDLAVDVPALAGVGKVDVDRPLSNRDPEP